MNLLRIFWLKEITRQKERFVVSIDQRPAALRRECTRTVPRASWRLLNTIIRAQHEYFCHTGFSNNGAEPAGDLRRFCESSLKEKKEEIRSVVGTHHGTLLILAVRVTG